jgi:hypothetical protein
MQESCQLFKERRKNLTGRTPLPQEKEREENPHGKIKSFPSVSFGIRAFCPAFSRELLGVYKKFRIPA